MSALQENLHIRRLTEGNRRFVSGKLMHPDRDGRRRAQISVGQHPFAAILGCSDSRVPPEIIFDQGLGDLFVVRNAGNIASDLVVASLEYAVDHLHVPLIVVLGHSSCGAVIAAVLKKRMRGRLPLLSRAIAPSVDRTKALFSKDTGEHAFVNETAKAHARAMAHTLTARKPILSAAIKNGTCIVVPAFYDVQSGAVVFLQAGTFLK